jgi:hypothetical protein
MNWEDPLKLESQLTQEEVMAMDMTRQYAEEKLLPRIVAANQNEQCVHQLCLHTSPPTTTYAFSAAALTVKL